MLFFEKKEMERFEVKLWSCYEKHWDILIFGAELFILPMVCMRKAVEINGGFAVISQQGSDISLQESSLNLLKTRRVRVLTCPPSIVSRSSSITNRRVGPRPALVPSACTFERAMVPRCGPVSDGRWRRCRTGHLTTSSSRMSSRMPPRSTCWSDGGVRLSGRHADS